MRQLLLAVSVLLLGLSWAIAQDTTNQSGQGSSTGSAQSSDSTGSTSSSTGSGQDSMGNSGQNTRTGAGGQMSVEGCLSGSDGNFTLTDKNGTSYQLTGDTAKLSDHVGHEVKVTGTSGTAATGSSGSTESSPAGAGSGQTLQVTSVKHMSKTCKSGSGGMSH